MSIAFSTSELINIAIGIERRGIVFYDIMTRSTKDVASHDIFEHLTDMERQHIHIFQDMLDDVDKYQVPGSDTEEYAAYLQALIDSTVFTNDFITSEMATNVNNDIEALELAINAEKDSVLFYYGMKDMMPRPAQSTVNKIIAEEKLHVRQLSELKKKLAAI